MLKLSKISKMKFPSCSRVSLILFILIATFAMMNVNAICQVRQNHIFREQSQIANKLNEIFNSHQVEGILSAIPDGKKTHIDTTLSMAKEALYTHVWHPLSKNTLIQTSSSASIRYVMTGPFGVSLLAFFSDNQDFVSLHIEKKHVILIRLRDGFNTYDASVANIYEKGSKHADIIIEKFTTLIYDPRNKLVSDFIDKVVKLNFDRLVDIWELRWARPWDSATRVNYYCFDVSKDLLLELHEFEREGEPKPYDVTSNIEISIYYSSSLLLRISSELEENNKRFFMDHTESGFYSYKLPIDILLYPSKLLEQ